MAGISNYLRNKIHDWLHRGQAFTPPATIYIALCTTQPTAATAGTEVTGVDYARVAITPSLANICGTQAAGSTTASSGTSGEVSNNAIVDFGTAGSAWGTPSAVSHWESYDALSGGNRLEYGTIVDGAGTPSPRTIVSGDPVAFPIGGLKFRLA